MVHSVESLNDGSMNPVIFVFPLVNNYHTRSIEAQRQLMNEISASLLDQSLVSCLPACGVG